MASPFAIFRKHQKEMMVILIGMAMFSWLVIDSINGRRGDASPTVIVMIIALIGAGIGYIWNIRDREKETPTYGWLNGAVIGAVAGIAFVYSAQRNEPGIDSAAGRIPLREIHNLRGRREIANAFVRSAFFKRENVNEFVAQFLLPRYLFGGEGIQEVVATQLLEKEADQFGIKVSNDYISDFIQEVSDKQLDEQDFVAICRQLGVNQVQLFDVLRHELRARLAMQLLNPASLYLPEQYWGDYQKFNVRHSIDATAIPVESFAASTDAPSEGELKKLFDEFKSVYPSGANPGFRVPEKKRLAVLTASAEQFKTSVGEISEDELKKLYEERKEKDFKADLLPDVSSGKDDGTLKTLDELKLPEPEKDGKNEPQKKDADAPAKPEGDKKADAAPADEKKPDAAKSEEKSDAPKTEDKKADEKKADDKKPADSGSDGGEETQDSNPPPKAEDKVAADKGTDKPAADKPAAEKTDEKPAAKPDDSSDKPAEKKPETAEKEPAAKTEKPTEAPKFKSFEEVREQLRDEVLHRRTMDALKAAMDDAKAFVTETDFKIGDEFADLKKDERSKKLKEKVEAYAKEKGLSFEETPLLSFEDFSTSKDIKLATATEPRDTVTGPFQQPRAVSEVIFSGGMVAGVPEKAELTQPNGELHFVFWVSGEEAEHVPEFTEDGVKQRVEKAFRLRAARAKAEERAKALAKTAEEVVVSKPLSEAFGGETVTGAKEAQELTVISPLEFSWLRQSFQGLQMNPFERQAPQIEFGFIPGVDKVNDDFMKAVSEMSVGDIKVLPNADKSTYYVVHLKGRSPSSKTDDPGMAALYDRFLTEDVSRSQIYGGLAQSQAQMIRSRWIGDFMRKHGVDVTQFEKF